MSENEIVELAKIVEQQAKQISDNVDMMIEMARNMAVQKEIIMDMARKVGLEPETLIKVKQLNQKGQAVEKK